MPKNLTRGGFDFRHGKHHRQLFLSASAPLHRASEHLEQSAFFSWCRLWPEAHPVRYFRAVPNGGWRHETVAAALKAEGVRPGVHDVYLPVARRGAHSLVLEFKVGDRDLSEPQEIERRFLLAEGNSAHTVWTWTEAARLAVWYLALPEPHRLPVGEPVLRRTHNTYCGCDLKI